MAAEPVIGALWSDSDDEVDDNELRFIHHGVIDREQHLHDGSSVLLAGAQRHEPSRVQIECRDAPTPAEFARVYRHKRPVKLSNIASAWPAIGTWQEPEYLIGKVPADLEVSLLESIDNQHFFKKELCIERRESFADALRAVAGIDHTDPKARLLYMRAPLLDTLLADISVPLHMINDPDGRLAPAEVKQPLCGVWISTRGNITPLHFDLCHGLLTQVVGRKRVTLFHPDDFRSLYPVRTVSDNPHSSRAHIEQWREDADGEYRKLYPSLGEVTWYETMLEPGQVLYIPPFWWHHVESLEYCISVLLPFDLDATEPIHPCSI